VYQEHEGVLHLLAGSRGAPGYDPHFFETLEGVEDRHFWFVGRRQVIVTALQRCVPDLGRRRMFDVGCGTGGLLVHFVRSGIALAGACDVYTESLRVVRRRVDVPLVLVDQGREPPLGAGHDLLGMFDVLEHVDDDLGMLKALHRALLPGGVLVLTVPAHPMLFGEMDELALHRRRYTGAALRGALLETGFEIRLLSHFMAPLVPALLAIRSLDRRRQRDEAGALRPRAEFRVVPGVNGAMRGILALERLALPRLPMPFGSSIVAVASRPR
jgi:SAM-dependent methyltransferase